MTDPGLDRPAYGLWALCVAVKLAIFAVAGRSYGYLSDELYFLDAADHLALGYVDYPPLIAWTVAGLTALLGTDLLVLRGFACIVGILVTVIAVDLVRILGELERFPIGLDRASLPTGKTSHFRQIHQDLRRTRRKNDDIRIAHSRFTIKHPRTGLRGQGFSARRGAVP